MSSPSPYWIRVYHLNIGIGDSGLIVVLKGDRSDPTLAACVLIDGGKASAWRQKILPRIELIKKDLKLDELRFSAIVLTHLDEDHWGGLNTFLSIAYNADNPDSKDFRQYLTFNNKPTRFYNHRVMYGVGGDKYNLPKSLSGLQEEKLIQVMDYTKDAEEVDVADQQTLIGREILWDDDKKNSSVRSFRTITF